MANGNFFQRLLGVGGDDTPPDAADRRASANIGASLIQQGQLYAAAGMANLQTTPAAQQGVMQGGMQIGADMANALRMRFYQKEFEMVSETGMKPLLRKLEEGAADVQNRTAIATRPI